LRSLVFSPAQAIVDTARILGGSPLSRPKKAIFVTIVLVVPIITRLVFLFQVYFVAFSPEAVQIFALSFLATRLVTQTLPGQLL
jgi:protease PrsW